MDTLLTLIKASPQLVLIIIGWVVINTQNNRRESRKEIRAALNDVQQLIKSAEKEALEFNIVAYDDELKHEIGFTVRQLSMKLNLASDSLGVDLDESIGRFRNSIMDNDNWEEHEFSPVKKSDSLLKEIKLESSKLSGEIEKAFYNSFHTSIIKRVFKWTKSKVPSFGLSAK